MTLDCQRGDLLGAHGLVERVRFRLAAGLGIRSGLRTYLRPPRRPARHLGTPSRFTEGSWVRVKARAAIQATLDREDKLRGLVWVASQWSACERVFRVEKIVRRIADDGGVMRAVSGTVLLEGCDCGGVAGDEGCGRHCPLMFRDEWLEEAAAPAPEPSRKIDGRVVVVRGLVDIERTLDWRGRRDGVRFEPAMASWCGKELRVLRRLDRVYELDRWCGPRGPVYLLAGAACSGMQLGEAGPCDRRCAVLWHRDWLVLEDRAG